MTKKRTPKAATAVPAPAEDKPIERAIDAVQAREQPVTITLPVFPVPRTLAPSGAFTLQAGADANERPIMFVGDAGSYRAIFAAPGTKWEIRPAVGPGLWVPGKPN
jgi:hypothetical protein